MRVLIIGGLSDEKFLSKTNPIVNNQKISRIYIFRAFGNIYSNNAKVLTAPFLTNIDSYSKGLKRIVFDLWSNVYFLSLLLIGKIDVVVGIYLYPYGFYASILSRIARKPYILVLPGSDLKKLIESKKYLKIFESANYFAVRGTYSKHSLMQLGINESKIFILHNVFEISRFTINISIPKIYDFIFVGYLRVLKRLDRLVQIVFELKKTRPNVSCVIVGDGPEKEKIQKMVIELNLTGNVIIFPSSTNIPNFLAKSKIFILTSDSEGLPMAIIEAMSCGLPVISSNVNDIPDIIQHGVNGFLIDPNNTQDFIKACNKLLDNKTLCMEMGTNARLSIEQMFKTDFSEDAQQECWFKFLNATIKKNEGID